MICSPAKKTGNSTVNDLQRTAIEGDPANYYDDRDIT